ncbi:molybdopterin-dependent oxidoreductase [Acidovorax sp.]|uniref:molybdopterin-dependent oxidoreductase n=1 Tax=Acidovorax sp. TaxID=1872122 RepID=UPI00260B0C93|nr:molybdopterin-dependent oxidoreductase [Acidovorax sp.]
MTENDYVQASLKRVSRFNDAAQAALFRPETLAPTFSTSDLTVPFRFNAFYSEASVPEIDERSWRLKVDGLVRKPGDWTLSQIKALPPRTEITRLICIEGWSAIGQWTGVPLWHFLQLMEADIRAKYVAFACSDGYYTSIDMASALHPQTMLAFSFNGQESLPEEFGFPLRLRIPTKLGFKNPKHLTGLTVSDTFTSGYWEDLHGYNWFAGL